MRRSSQAAVYFVVAACILALYLLHPPDTRAPYSLQSVNQQTILSDLRTTVDEAEDDEVERPQPLLPLDKVVVVPRLSSEDTDWVGAELPDWNAAIYTVDDPEAPLHTSVNKGREALVYLRYIIDNYNHLPNTIAFIHSHKDGYPKAWHNDNTDYSNVVTLKSLKIDYVQSHGFVNLRCNPDPGCPDEVVLNRHNPADNSPTEIHMPDVWPILFPNITMPRVLATACCAQIAVSRDQVLQRPLSDYKRYRQWILDTELSDAIAGRIMEYLWHVIFGQRPVFCPDMVQCYCALYGQCWEAY